MPEGFNLNINYYFVPYWYAGGFNAKIVTQKDHRGIIFKAAVRAHATMPNVQGYRAGNA
jgi:hypothetical protein